MKRNLAIITTAVSAGLTLVFIILLLCTAFGGLTAEDFDNTLVKTLLFVFSGIYAIDIGVAIYCQSHKSINAKEVQVAASSGGSVKVTPNAVKNLIKKNISGIDGIKFNSCALVITETGVQLNLSVAYSDGKKTDDASAYLQALVSDVCRSELDLRLSAVNVRVTGFKSTYVPDPETISRRAEEIRRSVTRTEDEKTATDETPAKAENDEAVTDDSVKETVGNETTKEENTERATAETISEDAAAQPSENENDTIVEKE